MTTEKITNLAESTLAAAYTAADGQIEVADGSVFDVGNRVRLDNADRTLLLVTAIAGDILTVEVEANDGNASSGDGVSAVLTEGVFDGYRGDSELLSTWAARASARKPGIVQRYTDAPYVGVDDGALIRTYGAFPEWGLAQAPGSLSFVWRNQGGASVDETNGYTLFSVPSQTTNFRYREIDAPGSTPYQITMAIRVTPGNGSQYFGPAMIESSTNKAGVYLIRPNTLEMLVYNLVNLTTHGTQRANPTATLVSGSSFGLQTYWFRIRNDGTNLIFSYSHNGTEWYTAYTGVLSQFFTTAPDKIGFMGNVDVSAGNTSARILAFNVE